MGAFQHKEEAARKRGRLVLFLLDRRRHILRFPPSHAFTSPPPPSSEEAVNQTSSRAGVTNGRAPETPFSFLSCASVLLGLDFDVFESLEFLHFSLSLADRDTQGYCTMSPN